MAGTMYYADHPVRVQMFTTLSDVFSLGKFVTDFFNSVQGLPPALACDHLQKLKLDRTDFWH